MIKQKVESWVNEHYEQGLVADENESVDMILSCIDDLDLVIDNNSKVEKDNRFYIEYDPKWADSYLVYEKRGWFCNNLIVRKSTFKEAEDYIDKLKIERFDYLNYKRLSKY